MKKEILFALLEENARVRKPYEFSDEILEKTIVFTKQAHAGVKDKMGKPYFEHPYVVCKYLINEFGNNFGYTEEQMNYACVLALLHDVVEDTDYNAKDICSYLGLNDVESEELTYGLSFVTHDKENDSYSSYIKKIAECPIIYPVWVKYCDLMHNTQLNRIIITEGVFLTGEDQNRLNRYTCSMRLLDKRLKSGSNCFKCIEDEVKVIDNFRTSAERKRMEKKENGLKKFTNQTIYSICLNYQTEKMLSQAGGNGLITRIRQKICDKYSSLNKDLVMYVMVACDNVLGYEPITLENVEQVVKEFENLVK